MIYLLETASFCSYVELPEGSGTLISFLNIWLNRGNHWRLRLNDSDGFT